MYGSENDDSIDSPEEFLTRRKMMAASTAMVTGGVAGCSTNENGTTDGSGDDTSDGSVGTDDTEHTIRTFHSSIPNEMNFNTWATSYPWTPTWLLLEPVLRFYADGSVSLELIDDWNYDEDTYEQAVHHNTDFHWWNGDACTAEDKYWYGQVAHLRDPESSSYEQLTLENNGNTIVREYEDPQNPQLINYQLGGYLGAMMRGHRDKYRPWAEELEDATTDDERTEIMERLGKEMPLNIETVLEEGLGMGPFEMVDYDEQGIYCELFDQHPYSDQINIDKFDYVLAANESVAQGIIGGEFDFGFGQLSNWIGDQDPDHVETIAPYEDTFMRKLEFTMQGSASEHLRKVEVRRAIAHAINLEHVATNNSSPSSPRTRQTGLPEKVTNNWLGDYVDDFIEYPHQGDEDGAVALMESAGYERDGGNWLDGDGETIGIEIVTPGYVKNPARTLSDQLSSFGFDVDLNIMEGAAYNDRTADSIDFDMTISSHGSLLAHPSYYNRPTHSAGNDLGDASVIEGALDDGQERSPYNGKKMIVEIPTEVGQEDLSGSTREINVYELYNEWLTAQTQEHNSELAETFAWYWNYYLPGIDLLEKKSGSWGKSDDWAFDVDDSWECYRGAFRAVKRGLISPK